MMQAERVEGKIGDKTLFMETGILAKQAAGAVVVGFEETVVLAVCSADPKPKEGADFLPLTIDYRDKTYAAGRIPGGFFKREARPSDRETLTSRLIDRSLRPMFDKGYAHETQVIINPLSFDYEHEAEILGLNGASAALLISSPPYHTAVAGIRIGRVDGKLIAYPTLEELEKSDMNMILAGTDESITMVEGGGNEISEDDLIEALTFGHEVIKTMCGLQVELAARVKTTKWTVSIPDHSADASLILEKVGDRLRTAVLTTGKFERSAAIKELRNTVIAEIMGDDDNEERQGELKEAWASANKKFIREMILSEGLRADGRKTDEVREISIGVDALPRTHGSVVFTRGETQALVTATLGAAKEGVFIDKLEGRTLTNFFLHYNFPGYCVGEVKRMMGPGRREVGHGALAERALIPMVPSQDDFPYTIRVVSDILESNGSSSMASVCGGSLALMDAGVPVKNAVAGIAMGMVQDGDRVAILSDILGLEDALGDMDFKVAGSKDGITAVQMDIKLQGGMKVDLMRQALAQAKEGRMHILGVMAEALAAPREELSQHAPRNKVIKINPEKVGALIGPGGKVIKGITADTGCQIDIADDGSVRVFSADAEAMQQATDIINAIAQEAEVGKIYVGTVRRIVDFGAFIEIFPGTDGLCHISEIADHRVERVEDEMSEGDEMLVKVINIDPSGKIRLSAREAQKGEGAPERKGGDRGGDRGGRGGDRGGRGGDRGGRGGGRGGRR